MNKTKELTQKAADSASFLLSETAEIEKHFKIENPIALCHIEELKKQVAEIYGKFEHLNYLVGE